MVLSRVDRKCGTYTVHVVMDLSNRPCLTHNLSSVLEHIEMIGDLSCEMFEHVLGIHRGECTDDRAYCC